MRFLLAGDIFVFLILDFLCVFFFLLEEAVLLQACHGFEDCNCSENVKFNPWLWEETQTHPMGSYADMGRTFMQTPQKGLSHKWNQGPSCCEVTMLITKPQAPLLSTKLQNNFVNGVKKKEKRNTLEPCLCLHILNQTCFCKNSGPFLH